MIRILLRGLLSALPLLVATSLAAPLVPERVEEPCVRAPEGGCGGSVAPAIGFGLGVGLGGRRRSAHAAPTITTVYTPFGETVAGWKRALKGSGFSVSTPTITIGGVACTSVTVLDDANLTYVGPAGISTAAAQDLALTTTAGSVTKAGAIWIAQGACLGLYDGACRTGNCGLNTLFQDSARTTAWTTDLDPVGGQTDLSTAALHRSQSTNGKRPLGKTSGLSAGQFAMVWDAVDDFMSAGAATATTTILDVYSLEMVTSAGAGPTQVWWILGPDGTHYLDRYNASTTASIASNGGGSQVAGSTAAVTLTSPHAWRTLVAMNGGGGNLLLYADGANVILATSFNGSLINPAGVWGATVGGGSFFAPLAQSYFAVYTASQSAGFAAAQRSYMQTMGAP